MDGKRPWMLSVQRFRRFVRMGRRRFRMVCVLKLCKPHGVCVSVFFFGNELESIPSQKAAETGKGENQDQP